MFSTHSWNVGVGANCAGRNSHHRAYRPQINSASAHVGQSFNANLLRDLVVNGKTIAKAGGQLGESCLCQVKWDGCTPRAGHHPTHLDSTGGW